MKYRSKRGTIINIPDGLDPKRVKAIKADADAGYGTRAQKTADRLGKKVASNMENLPKVGETPEGQPVTPELFDDKNKIIDPDLVLKNMPEVPGSTNLQEDVDKARNAAYSYMTKDYESQKMREMEDAKQELANRGIPYSPGTTYDPNTKDLYGQVTGGINRKYQDLYDQAQNRAIEQGNTILGTESGVAKNANEAFMSAVLGLSDDQLKRYGIDKDYQSKMAAIRKSGSSSSGGGGGANTGGGFEIV